MDQGPIITDANLLWAIAQGIRGAIREDHAVIDATDGFPYVIVRGPDGRECVLTISEQLAMYDEDRKVWWCADSSSQPAAMASAAAAAYGVKFGVAEGHVESLVWLVNGLRHEGVTHRVCIGQDEAEIAKHVEVVLSRRGCRLN